MRRKKPVDIRVATDGEKRARYRAVDALYHQGKIVTTRQHKSGFPAVTVDCEDIHLLTDILSLEEWWHEEGRRWDEKPKEDV